MLLISHCQTCKHHCHPAGTENRSKDLTRTSSGKQGRVLGRNCTHCWAPHKQTSLKKFVSGLRLLPGLLLLQPVKTWHSDIPTQFESYVSSWWNKVVGLLGKTDFFFFVPEPLRFPHRQTAQSIFCTEFRKKSPSDLYRGSKGREEKIYISKKVKAQIHTFICWSSHSVLSYSRQLLFYYQYLISI